MDLEGQAKLALDCSITSNFLKEWNRMCRKQQFCSFCPIGKYKKIASNCLFDIEENIGDAIEIVQNWSNKNQPEIDWTKVPIDTPVLVKDKSDAEWIERYFVAYLPNANEKFCAFNDGDTRENTGGVSCWNECRLATDVDPTPFINKE